MKGYNIVQNKPSIAWVDEINIDVLRIEPEYYTKEFIDCIEKIKNMNHNLLENIIEDVKDGPGGWGIKASEYVQKGIPMLRGVNIVDGLLEAETCVYITQEKQNELKRSKVVKNDVLLAVRGSVGVGKSAVYSLDNEANMNAAVVKITVKDECVDQYYLSCFFNSKYGRLQTERIANGVNQQNINLTEVKSNIIPIPSFEIQKYIGNKVRKAEELRKEEKRLKAELEVLFKQYTGLHYEETKIENDKRYGYIIPNDIGSMIVAEVYKPDYIENQRKIKKAGKFVNLNECYEYIVNGVDCRDYSDKNGTEYYKVGSISMFGIKQQNRTHINMSLKDIKDKQKINEGDLLITRKGSFGIAMAVSKKDEIGIISSEVFKLKIKNNWDADYLAYYLNSEFGKKQFNQYSTGSTMKGINQQNIVEIIIPYIIYNQQTEIGDLVRLIKNKRDQSKKIIQEAKQDVEDLIEGNFDMSKLN